MDQKQFRLSLRNGTRKHLSALMKNGRAHLKLLYKTAASHFTVSAIQAFERLVTHPGFGGFMSPRLSSSPARLEETLHLLFSRASAGIPPERVAVIAGEMSCEKFRKIERSFFMVPVDMKSFRLFERGFLAIGEQRETLLAPYLEFCESPAFLNLKSRYVSDTELFADLFRQLVTLLLSKKSAGSVELASRVMVDPSVTRLIGISGSRGERQEFTLNLFNIFNKHRDTEHFIGLIKILARRYPPAKQDSIREKTDSVYFSRVKQLWEFMMKFPQQREREHEFTDFLMLYGDHRDEFQNYVWDVVFGMPPEKSVKAVAIFTSTAFSSLSNFYQHNADTLRFLIRNIVTVLMELEIKDFKTSLYRMVLKLLMGLKVDRGYLQRRAEFFRWLKKSTGSLRVELEIIRFLFFEYIFIALKLVENSDGMTITKFCDDSHRFFCKAVDGIYGRKFLMRRINPPQLFERVLRDLRDNLWRPVRNKFRVHARLLEELISVAESMDREDDLVLSLEEVGPENIEQYHRSFMDVFRSDPGRMDEAMRSDFWYRVPLRLALPHVSGALFPLVGIIDIEDGGVHAYTEGKRIFLPSRINYFRDTLEPFRNNRNLTSYIGIALHEAGHIIAGSFMFDMGYFVSKLEQPGLFMFIWNCVEDFRIEKFLTGIRAHPQIEEILGMLNRYFSLISFRNDLPLAARLLIYIVDESGGYNDGLKSDPAYAEWTGGILEADVNTGRFRGIKELAENTVHRLAHIDAGNPLASYPLARELYEIMKQWPEPDLNGLTESGLLRADIHDTGTGRPGSTPLTENELDSLHRQYADDPENFLERHGLPVYPEIIRRKGPTRRGVVPQSAGVNERFIGELFTAYRETGPRGETADGLWADTAVVETSDCRYERLRGHGSGGAGQAEESAGGPHAEGLEKSDARQFIYSIDARTMSRTKLSEIREFVVRGTDGLFFKKFRRWEYLAERVYRQLALLLPTIEDELDHSATEGEPDMELLIETLSLRGGHHSAEFLDAYRESRLSLEVVIGLDASNSTGIQVPRPGPAGRDSGGIPVFYRQGESDGTGELDTIMDMEKTFAIIFGMAMSHLTDRVHVYAFNSTTSTRVYRAATLDAVSSFKEAAQNRDGDFIRYVRNKMEQSDADVKYFFLLSDGRPSSDNYQGREALDDTLIAMRETVNAGIKLIYFNIDLVRGDYFDLFKKEATHAEYFSSPVQLLPVIPGLIQKVVESVR